MDVVCRDVIRCLVLGMLFSIAMASGCTKDGFFGDNCAYECHCDGGKPCDKQTGVCPGACASGWNGEYCQRGNEAQGKPSQQSSTWSGQTAHYGNDGKAFTNFVNCANTKWQSQAWWKVDLGKVHVIFKVWLLNSGGNVLTCRRTWLGTEYRGSLSTTKSGHGCKDWSHSHHPVPSGSSNYCRNPDSDGLGPWCYYITGSNRKYDHCDVPICQALHSIRFWVDSKAILNYPGSSSYATYHTIGFQSPPVGRQLKIEQTQQSSLTLCELKISAFQYRACTDKRYGPNCNNRCQCTNDAKCDDKTGKCPSGCNDRFTGPYCNIEIPTFSQVGSSTPTSIKFQWPYIRSHDSAYNAGTVTKYLLRYSYKPGSTDSFAVSSPSGTVQANVTGLKPSTQYRFGLRVEYTVASSAAWNEGNPASSFSTASCSGNVPAPKITIPSNDIDINVAKPNRAYITIQIAVTGILGCFKKMDVYYKKSTAGTFISVASFTKQKGSETVQKLTPYTDYDIKAVVTSPDGITEESLSTIKTTDDVPAAPTVTEAGASPTTISIRVIPPDPPYGNITQYQLDWWKESGTPNTQYLPTIGLTPIFRMLVVSAKYNFRARAKTTKGWGDWSTQINIITRETIPGPPKTITVKDVKATTLKIHWTEPEFPAGPLKNYKVMCTPLFSYEEKVSNNLETYVMKSDPGSDKNELVFTKLTAATKYRCSVSAQTSKGYGQSAWQEIWTKVGTAEILEDLFPSVSTPTNADTTITIKIPRMPKFLKWGAVSKLIIVVEMEVRFRQKRSALIGKDDYVQFTDYNTAKAKMFSPPVYIAAKLSANFSGPFMIGDGKTYDGYYNPPLVRGEKYDVIFGMVFVANNISTVAYRRFGKFISVPTEDVPGQDGGMQVWPAIAITVGILGILAAAIIPAAVIMVWKKKDKRIRHIEAQ